MTFLPHEVKKPVSAPPASVRSTGPFADLAGPSGRDSSEIKDRAGAASLPFHLALLCSGSLDADRILALNNQPKRRNKFGLAHQWIMDGQLDEELYFQLAAKLLDVPFVAAPSVGGVYPPSEDMQIEGLRQCNWILARPMVDLGNGLVSDDSRVVCAPHGPALDRLAAVLKAMPHLARRICLTTPRALASVQRQVTSERALETQVFKLRDDYPEMSSHVPFGTKQGLGMLVGVGAVLAGSVYWSSFAVFVNFLTLSVFLSIAVLRLMAYEAYGQLAKREQARFERLLTTARDFTDWPSYTVLVPIYREARIVPDLVKALNRMDYPREKLSIMLLVEEDDEETRTALAQQTLPAHFEQIDIPVGAPRTKPKALNYALAFVDSDLVVIFDAEDRPHPSQLREAALRMAAGGPKLACLQGRLAVDNRDASFLSHQFAIEYSALFDGLLPFLASERLPVPLGGTSNHFRTDILKKIGGWDPYNVTEDADLGLRLTRLGYRIEILLSETWEEAPEHYEGWLRQRSRWFKGWMQTWLVHMRRPFALWKELGRPRFLGFQVMIAGMLISALIHPIFIVTIATSIVTIIINAEQNAGFFWFLIGMNGINLLVGYGGAMLLARKVAAQRYGFGWRDVIAMPVYWLMMTPAAWRALYQLIRTPHEWEKTEHGLSTRRPTLD